MKLMDRLTPRHGRIRVRVRMRSRVRPHFSIRVSQVIMVRVSRVRVNVKASDGFKGCTTLLRR